MEHNLHLQVVQSDNQNETSYYIHAGSVPQATKLFEKARKNLLHVNRWHQLAGPLSSGFQLMDFQGNPVKDREPVSGDLIRIERLSNGGAPAFDWVQVEEIEERAMTVYHICASIKVRPATAPNHSYAPGTQQSNGPVMTAFSVERVGSMVYASVYGSPKKEVTTSSSFLERLRQSIVQLAATLGIVKPEWRSLAKGMLSL